MGREIRSVPIGWEHPKNEQGHYEPLFDRPWAEDWAEFRENPEDYGGECPNPLYYRPAWPGGVPMGVQVYETVSEGTPVSPVFATDAELRVWLLEQGHSEAAADGFLRDRWAPSMVVGRGIGVKMGIDSCEIPRDRDER